MKKKSRGIVILCIYLMVSCVGGIGTMLFAQFSRSLNLNMPVEEKMKMIQTEEYKNLNVTSVEEFDRYWTNLASTVFNPYTFLSIILTLIFAIGIWFLFNWARSGLILLELFSVGFQVLGIIASQQVSRLFNILISVIIIYFLMHPKIKEQFNQLERSSGTANI